MSPTTSAQPSTNSRRATAAPRPRPAPVTIATLMPASQQARADRTAEISELGEPVPGRSRKNVCALAAASIRASHSARDARRGRRRSRPPRRRATSPPSRSRLRAPGPRPRSELCHLIAGLERTKPDPAREPVAATLFHQLEQDRRPLLRRARVLVPRARPGRRRPRRTRRARSCSGGHPGLAQTWPISPAEPRPTRGLPSITIPPPTPVPQKTPRNDSTPRPAPNRRSASTATLTSLPIVTGRPSSAASAGPRRNGSVQAVDVRDLDDRARRDVDRARSPDAYACELHRLHAGVVQRITQGFGELEDDRLRTALSRGVAACRADHRRRPVRHDGLDLRAAEIEPALHARHGSHLTTSSIGLRFARRSTPRPVPLGVARPLREPEREDDHRRLVLRRSSACRARSGRVIPFGHEAIPSAQAARSMLCAARPASNRTGPCRGRGSRRRDLPQTFSGTYTASASSSTRARSVGTTNTQGCEFRDDPDSRPASSSRNDELGRQRLGERAALVATAGDREQRVHAVA